MLATLYVNSTRSSVKGLSTRSTVRAKLSRWARSSFQDSPSSIPANGNLARRAAAKPALLVPVLVLLQAMWAEDGGKHLIPVCCSEFARAPATIGFNAGL